MSHIPQEIITDILTRLPVKSLLKFRCVSKPWNVLIDSRKFIKLHLNQTLNSSPEQKLLISGLGLYSADFDSMFETNIAKFDLIAPVYSDNIFGIDIAEIQVSGCCNGLVCLWLTTYNRQGIVLLWNPSTRKFRQLPDFGERGSIYDVAFGYDAINDDYKVVKILHFVNPIRARINVYSLRSNKLVKAEAFPYRCTMDGSYAVSVAGGLHWMAHTDSDDPAKLIVALNLTTDMTQLVPQPDCSLAMDFEMNLAVLGGSLSLVYYYNEKYNADIWIMKDYGKKESWTKIASITNSGSFRHLCPISFSKSGKQILLEKNDQDLVCYNLEKKFATNVQLQGHHGLYFWYGVYSGSLVQLDNGSPTANTNKKKNAKRDNFLSTGFKLVL